MSWRKQVLFKPSARSGEIISFNISTKPTLDFVLASLQ